MSNFDAKFDALFNGELKDDSLSSNDKPIENSYEDDKDVYFLSSGKNGEKNTIKLRMIPQFHDNDYVGVDNLFMLQKKVHKLREGTEKLNFNCLKFQNFLNFKKDPSGRYIIPEGKELAKCPCCDMFPWVGSKDENPEGYDNWYSKKPKVSGWVNVYIYNDTLNPENNGTVKKMYFDGRLIKMIGGVMKDATDAEGNIIQKGLDPFDILNGADLLVQIAKVGKWDVFDGTRFLSPTKFMNGDREKIKEIVSSAHNLADKVGMFYEYDELKKKLEDFYGITTKTDEVEEKTPENVVVENKHETIVKEEETSSSEVEEIIEEDIDFDVESLLDD